MVGVGGSGGVGGGEGVVVSGRVGAGMEEAGPGRSGGVMRCTSSQAGLAVVPCRSDALLRSLKCETCIQVWIIQNSLAMAGVLSIFSGIPGAGPHRSDEATGLRIPVE